jgi:hypothetical protein
VELEPNTDSWTANTGVLLEILDNRNHLLASERWTKASRGGLRAKANGSEWFSLQLTGQALPAPTCSYALRVTYAAPQGLG